MVTKDPEKNRVRAKAWARANREKNVQRSAEWRKANSEANREWSKAHPEARKAQFKTKNLKRCGVSLDEFEKMLLAQNGVCKICRQKCKTGRDLAVDHDHQSGKVRGLLCTRCNQGLGQFQDNPLLLRVAADYLERE